MESKFNGARATSPVGTQLLIALFMLTYHGLASAQPVDEDADVDDALEEVVVTGTRIRRTADFDLPVPVQSLSARDLEVAGVNQLAEAIIELPDEVEEQEALEDIGQVVRTKRFEMPPMSVEDAIFQMEMLGHTFFLFFNMDTEEYNVAYRRRDGDYGVIEPELA